MKKLSLLLLLSLVTTALWSQSLMRTIPFLQNPSRSGITVTWITSAPAFSYVEYGTDKNNLKRAVTMVDGQIIAGNTIHRIRLDDIEAGQKYYYRATSKEITLYEGYKKEFGDSITTELYEFTIPRKGDRFNVAVFNDLHKRNKTTDALAGVIEDSGYDLAIFNGDCIDDPKDQDDVVRFLEHAARVIGKGSVPMIFIRGNHEIRNFYSIYLRDIIEYTTEKSYGSFDWGDTRFVILDCGEDKPDSHWVYYGLNDFEGFRQEQVGFLERELKSKEFKKAPKKVLIHHIPIYNPEGTGDSYNPCLELWHPQLKGAPFNICLNAHTHTHAYYEPFEAGENTFPIIVGGGHEIDDAGVVVISRGKDQLRVKYITAKGETLIDSNY